LSWPSTIIPAEDTALLKLETVEENDFEVVAVNNGAFTPDAWPGAADALAELDAGPTRAAASARALRAPAVAGDFLVRRTELSLPLFLAFSRWSIVLVHLSR
jgi:hypothetical protein